MSVIMLCRIFYWYAEGHYADCLFMNAIVANAKFSSLKLLIYEPI